MPPKKSSKAIHRSVRINPSTSETDKRVYAIVTQLEGEGYRFKDIFTDAILHRQGFRPEMFNNPDLQNQQLVGSIQRLLAEFADDLLSKIKVGSVAVADYADDDGGNAPSTFAQNIAAGFMKRQAGN